MVETMRNLWFWIVETFKYDNTQQIFALSIVCFILMVFLFMAFNLNQMGVAGAVSFGSGAVRSSAGNNESEGGYFTGEQGTGETGTTMAGTPTTLGTVTTTTYPQHCLNNVLETEYGEVQTDCGGGGCMLCDCFLEGYEGVQAARVCGTDCPDKCDCVGGVNPTQCFAQYCCPNRDDVVDICRGKCAKEGEWSDTYIVGVNKGLSQCAAGNCVNDQLQYSYPQDNSVVTSNGVFAWY